MPDPSQPSRPPGSESPWDQTYNARESTFRSYFGAFPDQILKCMDLFVVWPGGCLAEFDSPKLGGFRVSSTFGLTNCDQPTSVRASQLRQSHDESSGTTTTSALLTGIAEPLPSIPGRAGYGYEIVALSRTSAEQGRPSFEAQVLHYLAKHQLGSPRTNILDTINDLGGMTFDTGPLPGGGNKLYLLTPFWDLVPPTHELPNGSMSLICLMEISPTELEFSRNNGPKALVDLMRSRHLMPISDPERESVI